MNKMNLEKETICGYEVSSMMKRLWAMELEMVEKFVSVCEEYGLKYWMMGGTLLGAVRHKGFIPWDNDIDLAMPRKDFNRLLEIGPEVFTKPLFFQTPVTEGAKYYCNYVKIRNENGTAASRDDYETGINCGVFIDIFCLDEIPDSGVKRKLYFRQLSEIAKMSRFALGKKLKGGLINKAKHFLQKAVYSLMKKPNAAELFKFYQRKAGRFAGAKKECIAHLAFGYHTNFVWDRKDWDEMVKMPFEYLELSAPKGFDAVLRRQYGNYMQIPEDKTTHDYIDFDPDIPYISYFGDYGRQKPFI